MWVAAASAAFLWAVVASPPAAGQSGKLAVAEPGDTVLATPEGRYDANAIQRFFLGDGHRDLWGTPVEVQVLDLDTFAGGLAPVRLGGGLQTRSLRLRGADGVLYNFRSLDKDASRTLDPELRRSIAARVLQDQIAALLPLGALVVAPLLEAADVLHADPKLVVMPTDPRLGEFLGEFGGLLGFIEERPDEGPDGTPGFAGSSRITGSERFLERLEEHPRNQVDDRAFLRARLVDMFVGDWDRHPDQWRWAAFEDGDVTRWEPIPRDRDWALARINGALVWAASFPWPHYKGYTEEYHSAFNTSWSGRALDRHLLSGTPREVWEEIASDLHGRLSDEVIDDAVARLPRSYQEKIGAYLARSLKHRRDLLPEKAQEYYALLATHVDIHATDEPDLALVEHRGDGTTDVRLFAMDDDGEPAGQAYFHRTFDHRETREVRVYLRGDDDRAVIRGDGSEGAVVRVIGGGSDDVMEDQTRSGSTYFYDDRGDNRFLTRPGTRVDESDYEQPEDPGSATHQAPPRDWGSRTIPIPVFSYDTDVGLLVGAGFVRTGYGFRYFPYRTRLSGTVAFGSSASRLRATLDWRFPVWGNALMGRIRGRWSGAEFNRYYGLGNKTASDGPERRFLAQRRQLDVEALLDLNPFGETRLSVGPVLTTLRPYENEGTLLESQETYGDGNFDQVGVAAHLTWDRRNRELAATEGFVVSVDGRFFPRVLDVADAFGGLRGTAALYVSPEFPLDPTLSLRAGGEKLWGTAPYFEAAYLGGGSTLRGLPNQRYAGDASLFANAELRVFLTDFFFLLPGDLGVFGLADVGRVYLDGETSDRWHDAHGGGLWVAFVDRAYTMSVAVARGEEETGVYLKAGFMF